MRSFVRTLGTEGNTVQSILSYIIISRFHLELIDLLGPFV
jgi:hypothetical protein